MFSRLNTGGRFGEQDPALQGAAATGVAPSQVARSTVVVAAGGAADGSATTVSAAGASSSTVQTHKTSVVGSSQARFLGEYNPLLSQPLERRTMNSGVVTLPELTAALDELQRSDEYQRNHKKKDSVKAYLDEVARFSSATKFRK